MTYYTHEYSEERFKTIEECREDLLDFIDTVEIVDKLDESLTSKEILNNFLRMDEKEFYNWSLEQYQNALVKIQEELISEIEIDDEKDE